jgi:protein SCO1/2
VSKAPRRSDVRVLILALLAAAAAAVFLIQIGTRDSGSPESQTAETQEVAIGGPFALTDQDGHARTDADFRGHLMLVYFGYSYCPDVCPLALSAMGAAIDRLGDKGDAVVPVFITVDPGRDTVAKLKEYAARFHPRLAALTGSADAIAQAAKAYRVYYAKHEEKGGPYFVDHSSIIFLMSRDGKYLTHFNTNTGAQEMAAKIAGYL